MSERLMISFGTAAGLILREQMARERVEDALRDLVEWIELGERLPDGYIRSTFGDTNPELNRARQVLRDVKKPPRVSREARS